MRLLAVGDIALSTSDGSSPFSNIAPALENKDILFGNLETVISPQSDIAQKSRVMLSSPTAADYLTEVGFNVLNVGNNHTFDAGEPGFLETITVLEQKGIRFVGGRRGSRNERDVIFERDGLKVGFLGYYVYGERHNAETPALNPIERKDNERDIRSLKSRCDLVVVSLHWGIEKAFYPSPLQIEIARSYIDCGATIILGHHPHVLQAVESYNGGLIAYSLGNFQFPLFDKEFRDDDAKGTDKSIILSVELGKEGIRSYELIPIVIDDSHRPILADMPLRARILGDLDSISVRVSGNEITWSMWFEQIAEGYLSENWNSFKMRIRKYGIGHLMQCIRWLISPFVLKCYLGLIRSKLRGRRSTGESA